MRLEISLAEEVLDNTIVLLRTSLTKKSFCLELSSQKTNSTFYLENAQSYNFLVENFLGKKKFLSRKFSATTCLLPRKFSSTQLY